jgi:hypothetical protein
MEGPMLADALRWLGQFPRQAINCYYPHFICGFCFYPLLIVFLLLPIGLAFALVGSKFGAHLLFFHDDAPRQFVGGIALGFYLAGVFFIGYLLSLRDQHEGRVDTWWTGMTTPSPTNYRPNFAEYCLNVFVHLGVTIGFVFLAIRLLNATLDVFVDPVVPATSEDSDWLKRWRNLWLLAGVVVGWVILAVIWGLCVLTRYLIGAKFRPAPFVGPPPPPRVKLWTLWFWAAIVVLLVVWARALWLSGKSMVQDEYWGPLVFCIVGTILTACGPVLVERGRPAWLASVFLLLAGLANGVLVIAAFTWLVSDSEWGVLLAAPAATALLVLLDWCFVVLAPKRWPGLWAMAHVKLANASPEERWALAVATAQFLAVLGILSAIILWYGENLLSPVPVVMLYLIVVLALYGSFLYAIRRAFFLVGGTLVLLGLAANLQPYRMRFEQLEDSYHREELVQLQKVLGDDATPATDLNRQARFNQLLKEYLDLDAEWERRYFALREALGAWNEAQDQADSETDAVDRARLQAEAKCKRDTAERLKKVAEDKKAERDARRPKLRDLWNEMEDKNRVLAGRLLPSYLDLIDRPAPEDDSRKGEKAKEPVLGEYLAQSQADRLLLPRDLKVWPVTEASKRRDRVLVVLAVSGGGIRAAYWTFAVLKELEVAFARQGIDFPVRVRLICGASGGMLGAAYYVSTLPHPNKRPPGAVPAEKPDELKAAVAAREQELDKQLALLKKDFLTPLTKRMVISDVPSWLSVWPLRRDRGQALEDAWLKHLSDPHAKDTPLGRSFQQLRDSERDGWRPSLVFTPMTIEDSRRLVISNLDLRYAISNDGAVLTSQPSFQGAENHSVDAVQFFRLFPDVRAKFRLSTAVRMSASFPFFSPAVSLPTVPRRRVVDAGYYDNYGVGLAASWLFSRDTEPFVKNFDRVLIIQIRDGVTEAARQLRTAEPDGSTYFSRSLEEGTSPPEGLYNATFGSSSFRNDGLLELYGRFRNLQARQSRLEQNPTATTARVNPVPWQEQPFLVANVELSEKASLSWYLSGSEKDKITRNSVELHEEGGTIQKIIEWWQKGRVKD